MFSDTRFRIGIIAGACAVGAAALALNSRHSQPEVTPGSTVLGVAAEGIRAVTYRSGAMALAARRGSAGPFDVLVTYNDGRQAQRCRASQDLAGLLPELSDIEARRQLTQQQLASDFPIEIGTLDLEDDVDEPISPFGVRLSKDRTAVAVIYSGLAVEANMSPQVFDVLGKGCAGLTGHTRMVNR